MYNLFEVHEHKSYTVPIIKTICSIAVIGLCIHRKQLFQINQEMISNIFTILAFLFTVSSIIIIYISGAEMIQVYEYRERNSNRKPFTYESYPIEEVLSWISSDDIISIEVKNKNTIVEIGAVSSTTPYSDFYDKSYYIDSEEFYDYNSFKESILKLFEYKHLDVISIDGIPVSHYFPSK